VTPQTAAGLAAAAVSVVGTLPYLRDVLRGRTRPHRGSWAIWTVLGVTAFGAQHAQGADWTLLMIGIQAVASTAVLLLSFAYGVGGLRTADLLILAVAGAGVTGWALSSQPLVAIACVVLADLAGAVLMLPKAWREPASETVSTYVFACGAGCLGSAAVGAGRPELLVYPVYFAVVNAALAAVLVGRSRVSRVRPWSTRPNLALRPWSELDSIDALNAGRAVPNPSSCTS
jgi:hypothetical protein